MREICKKALIVLIAAVGINVINGMLYTWSSFSLFMMEEWGWTSKEASLPYTVHTIFSVISMVLMGRLQDTKGPRLIATLGSISLGLGLILSGLTQGFILILIYIGILVGSGIGMQTVTTTPTAVKWFPAEKKGLISGMVSGGVAVSAIIYAFLGNYLLNNYGLNRTFLYMGIPVLISTTILSRMLTIPAQAAETKRVREREVIKEAEGNINMLRDKTFYKIWLMRAFMDSAGLMIIGHISIIASVQANWNRGFFLIIIISLFNTLGRVMGGFISDKIGRNKLLKYILIIQGINLALFFTYTNTITMALGVGIAGFCYGAGFGIFPAYISDLYGEKNFGLNYGILFTAWSFGGVIGPMAAATIFDATNSYSLAYVLELILLLIALTISFTIKNEKLLTAGGGRKA